MLCGIPQRRGARDEGADVRLFVAAARTSEPVRGPRDDLRVLVAQRREDRRRRVRDPRERARSATAELDVVAGARRLRDVLGTALIFGLCHRGEIRRHSEPGVRLARRAAGLRAPREHRAHRGDRDSVEARSDALARPTPSAGCDRRGVARRRMRRDVEALASEERGRARHVPRARDERDLADPPPRERDRGVARVVARRQARPLAHDARCGDASPDELARDAVGFGLRAPDAPAAGHDERIARAGIQARGGRRPPRGRASESRALLGDERTSQDDDGPFGCHGSSLPGLPGVRAGPDTRRRL
jgi:hypothetical protein